jgi:hypothetical protein
VVDSTLKGKRGKKNPLAKKGRLNEYAPFTFGLHLVILIAQWDVYRIPLAFCLVKPKGRPGYQSENALFREMLGEVLLPAWCKKVVVVADAAYPSRANLQAIQARGWYFVLAFPRTWKLANGQDLRDVVTHLPIQHYHQVRVSLVVPLPRRRVFWTFAKQAQLAHVGEVTVVLSRRRRNESPKHTKLLVTNLPHATAHLTVARYLQTLAGGTLYQGTQECRGLGTTSSDEGYRSSGALGGCCRNGVPAVAAATGQANQTRQFLECGVV